MLGNQKKPRSPTSKISSKGQKHNFAKHKKIKGSKKSSQFQFVWNFNNHLTKMIVKLITKFNI